MRCSLFQALGLSRKQVRPMSLSRRGVSTGQVGHTGGVMETHGEGLDCETGRHESHTHASSLPLSGAALESSLLSVL